MNIRRLVLLVAVVLTGCGESAHEEEGDPGPDAAGDASLGCWYQGKVYASGESTKMDCNTCWCVEGDQWECELVDCSGEPGKPRCHFGAYEGLLDERILCPDGCNTCTCTADELGGADWVQTDSFCHPVSPVMRCEDSSYERVAARAVYVHEDRLLLSMSCAPGVFRVCWDGSVRESDPSELTLWVENLDRAAPCDASGIASQEVFDVTSLRDAAASPLVLRVDDTELTYAW